jgi:hypothetical protein
MSQDHTPQWKSDTLENWCGMKQPCSHSKCGPLVVNAIVEGVGKGALHNAKLTETS